jgi:hypothetical protein
VESSASCSSTPASNYAGSGTYHPPIWTANYLSHSLNFPDAG